jgi:hypothetical protein
LVTENMFGDIPTDEARFWQADGLPSASLGTDGPGPCDDPWLCPDIAGKELPTRSARFLVPRAFRPAKAEAPVLSADQAILMAAGRLTAESCHPGN